MCTPFNESNGVIQTFPQEVPPGLPFNESSSHLDLCVFDILSPDRTLRDCATARLRDCATARLRYYLCTH